METTQATLYKTIEAHTNDLNALRFENEKLKNSNKSIEKSCNELDKENVKLKAQLNGAEMKLFEKDEFTKRVGEERDGVFVMKVSY